MSVPLYWQRVDIMGLVTWPKVASCLPYTPPLQWHGKMVIKVAAKHADRGATFWGCAYSAQSQHGISRLSSMKTPRGDPVTGHLFQSSIMARIVGPQGLSLAPSTVSPCAGQAKSRQFGHRNHFKQYCSQTSSQVYLCDGDQCNPLIASDQFRWFLGKVSLRFSNLSSRNRMLSRMNEPDTENFVIPLCRLGSMGHEVLIIRPWTSVNCRT